MYSHIYDVLQIRMEDIQHELKLKDETIHQVGTVYTSFTEGPDRVPPVHVCFIYIYIYIYI